ncbi:MAG: FG-GAP repeat protein [Myxococcota bacterium]
MSPTSSSAPPTASETSPTNPAASTSSAGPLAGPLTTADAAWVLHGDRPGEGAGFGLTAGDIDHDGRADLVVGAPTNDDAGYAAGKVYVLLAADLP